MKNPITFNSEYGEYFIWVSYWGVKVMKYFKTLDEVFNYIKANPNRCMEIKEQINDETLHFWKAELLKDIVPVKDAKSLVEEPNSPKKATRVWVYFFIFVGVFIINILSSPDFAIVTLISSITQAVGILIVVFIFLGIKKLFKRGK